MGETSLLRDPEACVDRVLSALGKRIVLGTPLGIGKPAALLNALYHRARHEPGISLDIITGLSLNPPRGQSALEERFYRPIRARVWGAAPRLAFLDDADAGKLPDNVRLIEFYVRAGSILGNPVRQQSYISSNYSHVARDMMLRGVNLVMQAFALREEDGRRRYSFSGNPDVSRALFPLLAASGRPYLTVGQVNRQLPWFGGAAEVAPDSVHLMLDEVALDHPPFAVPHEPVDSIGWAVGLRAASLVRDGGTLQVGIGALGDAVCHGLRLRARPGDDFRRALARLGRDANAEALGGDGGFQVGLYAASELISYPLFVLFEDGIVRRRVFEDGTVQREALDDPEALAARTDGTMLQGAFLLGPAVFYRRLSALSDTRRALIDMNSVEEVNRVYTGFALERLQRKDARFLNVALKLTLLGAAISDQLEDGKVLSGVGGQSDFVAMAHQLPGARSALLLRATAERKGTVESNIVFQYAHTTIPRHMRDLFVTEYGVADLRGKTDRECIEAVLAIADSRFQPALLEDAKRAGKLPRTAIIPDAARNNHPARIEDALAPLRARQILPDLPFGSDLTPGEWALSAKLKQLDVARQTRRGKLALANALRAPASADAPEVKEALAHLALDAPRNLKEHMLARLVRAAYALKK